MLKLERRDEIAIVTLDRPPANALNREFFVELEALLDRLAGDASLRAAVLTGTGRFFSAGLDLFEVFAYDEADFAEFTRCFDRGFARLFAFPKPLIAALNGHAIAGGAVLAACADRRLMAEGGGRAGLTELQLGVTFPGIILEIVRYGCAGRYLDEIVCGAATYPPQESAQRGLVDEVVPAGELLDRSIDAAKGLATILPSAFSATKRALRREALARIEAIAPGGDAAWQHWRSAEVRAAVDAYRQRTLGKKA